MPATLARHIKKAGASLLESESIVAVITDKIHFQKKQHRMGSNSNTHRHNWSLETHAMKTKRKHKPLLDTIVSEKSHTSQLLHSTRNVQRECDSICVQQVSAQHADLPA